MAALATVIPGASNASTTRRNPAIRSPHPPNCRSTLPCESLWQSSTPRGKVGERREMNPARTGFATGSAMSSSGANSRAMRQYACQNAVTDEPLSGDLDGALALLHLDTHDEAYRWAKQYGGRVIAVDGRFIGSLTNRFNSESVLNQYGRYGGRYESLSIYNPYGEYGSRTSTKSAYNPYTSTPPRITFSDGSYVWLTVNTTFPSSTSVSPDFVKTCTSFP